MASRKLHIDDYVHNVIDNNNVTDFNSINESNGSNPSMYGVVKKCVTTQRMIDKLKTRVNYKIYKLMLPTLIILFIAFFLLVFKKANSAVNMSTIDEKKNIISDEFNKSSDIYDKLKSDSTASNDSIISAENYRNQKQKELNDINDRYDANIYFDTFSDKFSDLLNGMIGAILMVYIGSAGYKMVLYNMKKNKNMKSCKV